MPALTSVTIVGAGKVGTALATSLRKARVRVRLVRARALPPRLPGASLVIIAVSDDRIAQVGDDVGRALRRPSAISHCAGALGPEVLEAAARRGHFVAQMHPLVGFAGGAPPSLEGAALVVSGDAPAVRACRAVARRLRMHLVVPRRFDRTAYHAASALAANGAATLAAFASELLAAAGFARHDAPALLGPLLRSVALNVERLGPRALSGPVRRGDAETIRHHLEAIARLTPHASELARAVLHAQARLSSSIGEADPERLAQIMRMTEPTVRS